jgi:hypothetical protein
MQRAVQGQRGSWIALVSIRVSNGYATPPFGGNAARLWGFAGDRIDR